MNSESIKQICVRRDTDVTPLFKCGDFSKMIDRLLFVVEGVSNS